VEVFYIPEQYDRPKAASRNVHIYHCPYAAVSSFPIAYIPGVLYYPLDAPMSDSQALKLWLINQATSAAGVNDGRRTVLSIKAINVQKLASLNLLLRTTNMTHVKRKCQNFRP
jgi:hypothetical protein